MSEILSAALTSDGFKESPPQCYLRHLSRTRLRVDGKPSFQVALPQRTPLNFTPASAANSSYSTSSLRIRLFPPCQRSKFVPRCAACIRAASLQSSFGEGSVH